MDLFDELIPFFKHKGVPRRIISKLYDKLFILDDLIANRENLIEKKEFKNQLFEKRDKQFLIFYVTYGKNNPNHDFLNKFADCLIVIENVDDRSFQSDKANITRRNMGFDLGAYRDILQLLVESEFRGDVLLINSSCTWNAAAFSEELKSIRKSNKIYFPTLSHQGGVHYQTFFIYIPALYLEIFSKYAFARWKNWRKKRNAVSRGEKQTFELNDLLPHSVDYLYHFESKVEVSNLQEVNPATNLVPNYITNPIFVKLKN